MFFTGTLRLHQFSVSSGTIAAGYAAVRMHTLDGIICYLSKEDMELDPKAFDRVMYSFYRFKWRGAKRGFLFQW